MKVVVKIENKNVWTSLVNNAVKEKRLIQRPLFDITKDQKLFQNIFSYQNPFLPGKIMIQETYIATEKRMKTKTKRICLVSIFEKYPFVVIRQFWYE